MRAAIALLLWVAGALGAGYFSRHGIEQIFGPDSWWLVTGWLGAVIGLFHFLLILILARKPRNGG
jgi:hypothetical protein